MLLKALVLLVSSQACSSIILFDPIRLLQFPNIITSLLVQDPGPYNEDPLPTTLPLVRDDRVNEIPRSEGVAPSPSRLRRLIRAAKEEEEDDRPTINAEPGIGFQGNSRTAVGVDVPPFVNVKVATSGSHRSSGLLPLSPDLGSVLPDAGSLIPGLKPRGPLDLRINIPSIFRLDLKRDEDGGRRLGIGVLPVLNTRGLVSVGVDTRSDKDEDDD